MRLETGCWLFQAAARLLVGLSVLTLGPSWVEAQPFSGQRWAVVIGVSDYEDSQLEDLQYADDDARAFRDFLRSLQGGAFPEDHIRFLENTDVTAASIREAFGTFIRRAEPQDYVVIFLAGHGLPDPHNTSDFYFLPHNARLDQLPSTAVLMWELQRWIDTIKAERVVVIADACHSGALGSSGRARGPNEINRYHGFQGGATSGKKGLFSWRESR